MSFKGVENKKVFGGLGRRNPSTDAIFGIVFGGVAATGLALQTIAKLIQIEDAENLGINSAYDANNSVLVHYHISEFFTQNPNGTLYIMLVAQGTTQAQMVDLNNQYLNKLLLAEETNREIKYAGTVLNPVAPYAPINVTGVDPDIIAAVPKAQALIDDLAARQIFIDGILLEGRNISGTIGNLLDLRTLASRNVSVCIAHDPFVDTLDVTYAKTAAIGTALGGLSVRKVSENLGSVDIVNKPDIRKGDSNYSLTDRATGKWLTAQLTSGVLFSSLSVTEFELLTAKGWIYAGFYEGFPGVYFSDAPTAIEAADDYAFIEMNRTWNKAARIVRTALIPKIKSEVEIENGQISSSIISEWQEIAKKNLNNMLADGEVSSFTFSIDASQNVLAGDPIITKLAVVPKGIAREIINELGFENPFN